MTRFRVTVAMLALLLLGVGAALLVAGTAPVETEPVAIGSAVALSGADRRFYQEVAPVLRAAAGESRELTRLGEERSRNLFAIRAGQARLNAHLHTLDALFAAAGVPARFAGVAAVYHPAAATVREAMAAAEAAFLRFDWEGVGAATARMAIGTAQLEAAATGLDRAAGAPAVATPSPTR